MKKVGRPTKYTSEMPAKLIEAMFEGKSVLRFCRDIRVDKDTFYEWVKVHPEFSAAFRQGKTDCEAFWEDWLVEHLGDKNVNGSLVRLFMTNRFGWSDKKDISNTLQMKPEDALKELDKE